MTSALKESFFGEDSIFHCIAKLNMRCLCLLLGGISLANLVQADSVTLSTQPVQLLFKSPAKDWEREGLPIGNGAIGSVVMGEIKQDRLQFNEKTLWTGGPNSVQGYDFGIAANANAKAPAKIAQEIFEKTSLAPEIVAERIGHKTKGYGDYQTFGDLVFNFSGDGEIKHYQRNLDLTRALARVSYEQSGIEFKREYFASYPDSVIAMKFTASQAKQLNFSVGFAVPENRSFSAEVISGNTKNLINISGALNDNKMAYAASLSVVSDGQVIQDKNNLKISNASYAVLLLSAATDYVNHYPNYRSEKSDSKTEQVKVAQIISKANEKSYQDIFNAHIADYQSLFNRVTLDLGQAAADHSVATSELLDQYQKGSAVADRLLETTYFQYGRYLLIASSRAGSLPANLQGVWNRTTTPPWNDDYHVNINLQMNYWPAEVTNISETTGPLFDFVDSLVEPGKISAQKILGAQGWTLFLNTNIFGFTGVIKWPTAFWQPEAGAWLAQHYYEHYLFTGDQQFLRERAFPVMKSAAEFWFSVLVKDPKTGKLLVAPSYSPEHGPFVNGAAMSQQIVYDLFSNCVAAANLLGDKVFAKKAQQYLTQLDSGLRIGSWGQLQEWRDDLDDPKDQHRHVSHLFALHPGHQIDAQKNPTFFEAAKQSLSARGDGGTGWSQAWKINLWARLQDGDHAHQILAAQLHQSTLPNLWDNHPPFQIDGNFGATAGIAEMLLQSQNNVLQLLPALPSDWSNGSVTGLRARGNVSVAMQWMNHQLITADIHSFQAGTLVISHKSLNKKFQIKNSAGLIPVALTKAGDILIQAKANENYQIINQ